MTDYRGGPALTSPVLLNAALCCHCELLYGCFLFCSQENELSLQKLLQLSFHTQIVRGCVCSETVSRPEWSPTVGNRTFLEQTSCAVQCSALHDLQKPSIVCWLALVSVYDGFFLFIFLKWSETKTWKNSKGTLSVSTYLAYYFIIAIIYQVPFCKTVWCKAHQKICGKQHSPKRLTLIGNSFCTLIWGSFNLFF